MRAVKFRRRPILARAAGRKGMENYEQTREMTTRSCPRRQLNTAVGRSICSWAAGRELRMSTEPHRSRTFRRQRHGAGSVRVARAAAACAVASRLRSSSSARLSYIALSGAVGVASFGAGLRLRRRARRFGSHRVLQFNPALLFARSAQGCIELGCFARRRCPTIRSSRRLKQLRLHFASVLARLNSTVGLLGRELE